MKSGESKTYLTIRPGGKPGRTGVEARTVSTARFSARWRRFFVLFLALAASVFFGISAVAEIIGLNGGAFYLPADSTVYYYTNGFDPNTQTSHGFIFRLKEQGRKIERSPIMADSSILPLVHDNIPGHLFGHMEIQLDSSGNDVILKTVVTSDGGDSWADTTLPFEVQYPPTCAPGEHPGESFMVRDFQEDSVWVNAVFSTKDGWQSWDTNRVVDNWNDGQYLICFGQRDGQLIRVERDHRDKLDFSSDTGRTWATGYVDGPLPGYYTVAGTGTEIYRWTGGRAERFYCIQDSGRTVSMVFDATDYFDYDFVDTEGNIWGGGNFVPTGVPGEFYAVEDSAYWWDYGIKLHVYHVTNYGADVEIYYYNMPNYDVCEPEAVISGIHPVPRDAEFLAYPNPFNSTVLISFAVPHPAPMTVALYDLSGRRIAVLVNDAQSAGFHTVNWSANNVPTGIYFVRMSAPNFSRTQRLVLMK